MNIKEAIKEIRNNYYTARDFVGVDYVRAIETVLNELDKQNKALYLMAQELTTPIHGVDWIVNYYLEKAEENK